MEIKNGTLIFDFLFELINSAQKNSFPHTIILSLLFPGIKCKRQIPSHWLISFFRGG